jgi:hypothetical protein
MFYKRESLESNSLYGSAVSRPRAVRKGYTMNSGFVIITNNTLVKERLGVKYDVEYYDISYEGVLRKVRDMVYLGHELLTHPLSGSVKPNETPYKSVMVAKDAKKLDMNSMDIIERAIHSCSKFEFRSDKYRPEVYDDFKEIDLTLIESAIPSTEFQYSIN